MGHKYWKSIHTTWDLLTECDRKLKKTAAVRTTAVIVPQTHTTSLPETNEHSSQTLHHKMYGQTHTGVWTRTPSAHTLPNPWINHLAAAACTHTQTLLPTATCRSQALEGLTLQHTQSWDFPTPPRTLSYIFCQSRCAGLQAHCQLQALPETLRICQNAEKLWCARARDRSKGGLGSIRCLNVCPKAVVFFFLLQRLRHISRAATLAEAEHMKLGHSWWMSG